MPTTTRTRQRRRSPRPARGLLAVVLAVALFLVACGDSGSSNEEAATPSDETPAASDLNRSQGLEDPDAEPVEGGKVIFGLEAETDGFNPVVNRWASSGHYVGSAIFDPLATLDEEGNAVPYLAESIERNEDATEWTITLRPDVVFHDGTPLTADAVAATLEAHRGSVITSKPVAAIEEIEVVDPLTAVIRMNEPWFSFPYTLTTQIGYVVPEVMTRDLETTRRPIGTGPFRFVEWDQNRRLIVERNENYWQAGKPHIAEIEFRPIPDSQARKDQLLSGEIDLMHTWNPMDVAQLRTSDVKMVEVADGESAFIVLNTQEPPFDNLDARLAVTHAIDVERYLDETGRGVVVEPSRGGLAPGRLGYREDNGYLGYDLEAAKRHAAAYEEATGEPLRFVYLGASTLEDLAAQQSLNDMWEEAGIEVEIRTIPQADQILNAALGSFEAVDFRNFGATDPDGEFVWWHSRSIGEPGFVSLNFPRLGDDQIDESLEAARATDDPEVRDEAYAVAARRLNELAPYLWLERVNWALVSNPRVNGMAPALNGSLSTLGAKTWIADLWLSN